jgi:hypothetical protein
LFVCITTAIEGELTVMAYDSARPFVTVAVIGMIIDLPAGKVTLLMGLMTGAEFAATVTTKDNTNARFRCTTTSIVTATVTHGF